MRLCCLFPAYRIVEKCFLVPPNVFHRPALLTIHHSRPHQSATPLCHATLPHHFATPLCYTTLLRRFATPLCHTAGHSRKSEPLLTLSPLASKNLETSYSLHTSADRWAMWDCLSDKLWGMEQHACVHSCAFVHACTHALVCICTCMHAWLHAVWICF